jgi:hypothetical protein
MKPPLLVESDQALQPSELSTLEYESGKEATALDPEHNSVNEKLNNQPRYAPYCLSFDLLTFCDVRSKR